MRCKWAMRNSLLSTTAGMHRASARVMGLVTMSQHHTRGLEKRTHSRGESLFPYGCLIARCYSAGLGSSLDSLRYAVWPLARYCRHWIFAHPGTCSNLLPPRHYQQHVQHSGSVGSRVPTIWIFAFNQLISMPKIAASSCIISMARIHTLSISVSSVTSSAKSRSEKVSDPGETPTCPLWTVWSRWTRRRYISKDIHLINCHLSCISHRAGLTSMPVMPWHGAPGLGWPPLAA